MSPVRLAAVLPLAFLASAATAQAGTVVPVGHFEGIDLHGGGQVVLKHGPTQRVEIIKGSTQYSEFTIEHGNTLNISPCKSWFSCPTHYELVVEITTPSLPALDVHGGGELETRDGFPHQRSLAVAVHGGGEVDVRNVAVDDVSADVHGGGELSVRAEKTLTAAVHGGGEVTYWGHPQVTSAIGGGGEISSGS
jgi:hypothetical protein